MTVKVSSLLPSKELKEKDRSGSSEHTERPPAVSARRSVILPAGRLIIARSPVRVERPLWCSIRTVLGQSLSDHFLNVGAAWIDPGRRKAWGSSPRRTWGKHGRRGNYPSRERSLHHVPFTKSLRSGKFRVW